MTDSSNDTIEVAEDISIAARFYQLATESGSDPALTFGTRTYTFAEIGEMSNRLARHYINVGVKQDDMVTIAAPNGVQFVTSAIACWKMGAIPQPVSSRLPGMELETIVDLANSSLVIGVDLDGRESLPLNFEPSQDIDDSPLPDCVSSAWKAPTSGGSTGRPKLIVSGDPSMYGDGMKGMSGTFGTDQGHPVVMPGPLYHNGPFMWTLTAMMAGTHVILLQRFDAEETLRVVDKYGASAIYLVPTMMQRMWKLPDDVKFSYNISSIKNALHLAEPCPDWLKEAWIDWIGAESIWELYGGTEGQLITLLDGVEWLAHRGSVGTPQGGEIKICDEDGNEVPVGETGEIWMRSTGRATPSYRYIGAEADNRDGWECLGDIGRLDADGYLYLTDRRKDMILVGGANIYPAEIEAAINAHPQVQSCVVIGLPSEDSGSLIHAIVQANDLDESALLEFLAERLVRYKLPRTIEWSDEPLRDDAGKVRRGALQQERTD